MADERRTDRGLPALPSGEPAFTVDQRVWLLERDFDNADDAFDNFRIQLQELRKDQRDEHAKLRSEVGGKLDVLNSKLWWLVGIGFSLLVAVIAVLATALTTAQ